MAVHRFPTQCGLLNHIVIEASTLEEYLAKRNWILYVYHFFTFIVVTCFHECGKLYI